MLGQRSEQSVEIALQRLDMPTCCCSAVSTFVAIDCRRTCTENKLVDEGRHAGCSVWLSLVESYAWAVDKLEV